MSVLKNRIVEIFEEKFSRNPFIISSPGRVNLIGEHTDYNEGFVLPAAIDKYIYFAVKPNNSDFYNFYSYNFNDNFSTDITNIEPVEKEWVNYLLGVISQVSQSGRKVEGFDCVFGGDIPIGSGISSSAAIECGMAFAINQMFDFMIDKLDLVKFSQKAEHEYAGVKCGIMDQFAVMFGKENFVIKLDCKTLEHKYYPLETIDYKIVLVNSGVKHSLAASEYNVRRQECETGVNILKNHYPNVNSLRDVSLEMLQEHKKEIPAVVFMRCEYVIEENMRLQTAANNLTNEHFETFGKKMYESHEGLKTKYNVSCKELDFLVDLTKTMDYVLGSRMMGGGFGGCTINLVKTQFVDLFEKEIIRKYRTPNNKKPDIIKVVIADGTKLIY